MAILSFLLSALLFVSTAVVNVQNKSVTPYLENVQYDNSDYSYSEVKKYCKKSKTYREDHPESHVLAWAPSGEAQTLSVRSSSGRVFTRVLAPDDSIFVLSNFIPGCSYRAKVTSGSRILVSERIKAEGQLRMIKCPSIHNVRDIGGWKAGGKHIRYGRIYRGGELNGLHGISINAEDASTMVNVLGIRADIDLRNSKEIDGITASPMGDGAVLHIVKPVQFKVGIFSDPERFAVIFRLVLDYLRKGEAVYIHCWGGADRTGATIMCLEGLLGVEESDLMKDYELTSFSRFGVRHRDVANEKWNVGEAIGTIKALPGDTLMQKWESFALSGGITAKEIREFRRLMLSR